MTNDDVWMINIIYEKDDHHAVYETYYVRNQNPNSALASVLIAINFGFDIEIKDIGIKKITEKFLRL